MSSNRRSKSNFLQEPFPDEPEVFQPFDQHRLPLPTIKDSLKLNKVNQLLFWHFPCTCVIKVDCKLYLVVKYLVWKFFLIIILKRFLILENLRKSTKKLRYFSKTQKGLFSSGASEDMSSKSSFFVQKFNFQFPRKLSIFLGEKLVKMFWFWTF